MDLIHLYYVLEVARYGSFTKAAEALYTTQPNVSKQINTIEEELGIKLFDRRPNGVLLTADGERFCKHASKVADDFDELMAAFNQHTSDRKAVINIAVFPFFQKGELATTLRRFLRNNAHIVATLKLCDNYQAYSDMLDGDIDFSILKMRPRDCRPEFKHICLIEEPMMCIMSKSHPLATASQLSVEDLKETILLTGEDGTNHFKDMEQIYKEHNIPFKVGYQTVTNIDFMIDILDDLNGVTLITESSARSIQSDNIAVIPIKPTLEYNTYLVYPRGKNYSGIYKSFIEYVRTEMKL